MPVKLMVSLYFCLGQLQHGRVVSRIVVGNHLVSRPVAHWLANRIPCCLDLCAPPAICCLYLSNEGHLWSHSEGRPATTTFCRKYGRHEALPRLRTVLRECYLTKDSFLILGCSYQCYMNWKPQTFSAVILCYFKTHFVTLSDPFTILLYIL